MWLSIEKIQRDFHMDDFKFHLVEWDKVCTPIVEYIRESSSFVTIGGDPKYGSDFSHFN
jgi:hypothetical protein